MDQTPNPLSRLLNAGLLTIGHTTITPAALISASLIMALAFGAARFAGVLFLRLRTKAKSGRTPLYIVEKLITYGLVTFGLVVGLSTLELILALWRSLPARSASASASGCKAWSRNSSRDLS